MKPPSPVPQTEDTMDSQPPPPSYSHQYPLQPAVAPTIKKSINWRMLILMNLMYLAFSWLTAVTRQSQLDLKKQEEEKKEEEKEKKKQKKLKKKHKKSKRQKKLSVE